METSSTRSSSTSSSGQLLDVLGVLVLSQHPDLLWAPAQPIPGPGLPRLSRWPSPAHPRSLGAAACAPPGHDAAARHLHPGRGPRRRRSSTAGPCCSAAARSACSGSPSGRGDSSSAGGMALRSGRAVLPNCWRGGWRRAVPSSPGRPSSIADGPGRRHRRGAGPRPARPTRPAARRSGRAGLHRGRRRVGRRRARPRRSPSATAPPSSGWPANVGPAGARNAGLAAVHSPLVAFVDSDCVPADGWLGPLLGHFDDPVVAAVAPRIVSAGRPRRFEAARVVARPWHRGGPGAAREPHPLRPERGSAGPGRRGDGTRPLRCGAPWRRGRGPGLATGRGRLGRPLRPVQHRGRTRARPRSRPSWPAAPSTERRPRR